MFTLSTQKKAAFFCGGALNRSGFSLRCNLRRRVHPVSHLAEPDTARSPTPRQPVSRMNVSMASPSGLAGERPEPRGVHAAVGTMSRSPRARSMFRENAGSDARAFQRPSRPHPGGPSMSARVLAAGPVQPSSSSYTPRRAVLGRKRRFRSLGGHDWRQSSRPSTGAAIIVRLGAGEELGDHHVRAGLADGGRGNGAGSSRAATSLTRGQERCSRSSLASATASQVMVVLVSS
jgi:hypothetical protein